MISDDPDWSCPAWTTEDERLLTRTEVARMFGFSISTLGRLILRDRRFPSPVLIGGSRRWKLSEIRDYLAHLPRAEP